jgi:hypothetical protein
LRDRNISPITVRRYMDYDRIIQKDLQTNRMELLPGVWPCLSYVESILDSINNDEDRQNFKLRYGLNSEGRTYTYSEIATDRKIDYNDVVHSVVRATRDLQKFMDPNWQRTRKCSKCGAEFEPYRNQTYCNRECSKKLISGDYGQIPCYECGLEFQRKRKDSKYCSKKCKDNFLNKRRKKSKCK